MNIPEHYEDVSLKLTEVLDAIGLREDLRWQRINTWLQIEELDRIHAESIYDIDARMYCFGSQPEATTTPQLLSDIDRVHLYRKYVVLHDLRFWVPSLDTKKSLLMVTDESTPSGYVKLQLLHSDAPIPVRNYQNIMFHIDTEGRSVLYNGFFRAIFKYFLNHVDSHGPAITTLMNGLSCDMVVAIPCRYWPDEVSRRMSTARINYNWPTKRMMDVIKQTPVLLVPVGQRSSPQQHLEWRLSFSFAEKLLMMQFNSTQYKCYVMLKFIKKTFINVHDVENVLTSYHCKTCMFYLIVDTPASLWQPNNLMLCMDLCLKLLLSWVQSANCPNFFVPDENMFLGKLTCLAQEKIARILQDLLQQNGRYVTIIPHENIGDNVVRVCQSLCINLSYTNEYFLAQTISELMKNLDYLSVSLLLTDREKFSIFKPRHGTRQEIGIVLRALFCSAFGNHLASQSLKQEMCHQEKLIVAHEFLLLGSSSDVASGKLKLAAFYLAMGKLDAMEDMLKQVDANFTHTVYERWDIYNNLSAFSKIPQEHLSITNFIQKCFAFTVFYSLSDIHCIPKVLIFEIFRSTDLEGTFNIFALGCFPLAVVTAKAYLYFLQYQCYLLKGRVAQRYVSLNNMICVYKDYYHKFLFLMESLETVCATNGSLVEMSPVFIFITTSMNLMAYCLKQEGRPMDAFKVLCLSMKANNQNNGAKWQIATFINSAIKMLWVRQ
ncbi:hypothetical protein CHS0354_006773 [Potamilus streckersoni]|nr:hypothetical protein CHS0354_006773 [Potamilus streckersoni]